MKKKKTISGTQQVNFQVDEEDLLEKAIEILKRECDLQDYFLSQSKTEVRQDDEYYHGSATDHLVRSATEEDLLAFKCVALLEEVRKKL